MAAAAVLNISLQVRCAYRVLWVDGSSLCFLRMATIGLPHFLQKENPGQPSPATILSSRFLISFLQLSHFVTNISEKEFTLAQFLA